MKKKSVIIVAIILMAVGFATLATNLIINGNVEIGNKAEDYEIIFTSSILEGVENNNLIIDNGKKIRYETKVLMNVGDTSELIYEISNNSREYDGEVSINCTPKGTTTHTELYSIDTTNTPDIIKAKTSEVGSIKITLNETTTEEIREEFECELNINALERTTPGVKPVYGVKRAVDSSSTKWERIESSVGLVATATHDGSEVENDFDNIYPWSEIITYNYDTETKTETAVYGDENFAFDGSNGQVLTRIPEFYYKREVIDGVEYQYISKYALDGFTKSEEFSIGRYTMSGDSNKVYSKSGVTPLVNTTITNFRNYARNLGSDFGQLDWRYFILQMLYLVEYADYNSQNMLGLGNVNNSGAIASGGCDTLGMKSGTLNNDGKHSVIYRGIEDIFGNVWQWIDGINVKDHIAYINYNPETYQADTFDGDYQMLGYTNANVNGFTMQLGYDSNHPLVSLPTVIGGNENTYIGDNYWQGTGNNVALVGGAWDRSTSCGLWSLTVSTYSSNYGGDSGSRLLRG